MATHWIMRSFWSITRTFASSCSESKDPLHISKSREAAKNHNHMNQTAAITFFGILMLILLWMACIFTSVQQIFRARVTAGVRKDCTGSKKSFTRSSRGWQDPSFRVHADTGRSTSSLSTTTATYFGANRHNPRSQDGVYVFHGNWGQRPCRTLSKSSSTHSYQRYRRSQECQSARDG